MANWKKGKQLNNGQYVIESISLRSGAGVAYKAREVVTGNLVTIKAIEKIWHNHPQGEDLEQKLTKQAVKISRCGHPYLVKVYSQVLQEDNQVYMVMDYLDGDDLASYLDRNGKLEEYSALKLITKIASAVNVLHQNRVVHQEIKPQNIILHNKSQEPILADYGLAIKLFSFSAKKAKNNMMDAFCSPEINQEGVKIGPYSDIYSLAATLYVLVTGQLPTLAQFRQYKPLIPPQQLNPSLSDRTNQAIVKGMSLNYQERPQCVRDWFALLKDGANKDRFPQKTENQTYAEIDDVTAPLIESPPPTEPSFAFEINDEDDILIGDDEIVTLKSNSPPSTPANPVNPQQSLEVVPKIESFEFETVTIKEKKKLFNFVGGVEKQVVTKQNKFFVEYLGEGVNLEMVFIPSGSFLMGSASTDTHKEKDETPPYRINVFSYYLSKYPITQLQWRIVSSFPKVNRLLKTNPSSFKGDNLPVEKISWYDAQEFCLRLSAYTKRKYHLPSEAQWEYACRGGTTTTYSFGDIITPEFANYNPQKNPQDKKEVKYDRKTTPVDTFSPNPYGLYDFHGNVWEWCEDHYSSNYAHKPKDASALTMKMGNPPRVVRGGSWSLNADYCRSAKRSSYSPDSSYNFVGFRVVCDLES